MIFFHDYYNTDSVFLLRVVSVLLSSRVQCVIEDYNPCVRGLLILCMLRDEQTMIDTDVPFSKLLTDN